MAIDLAQIASESKASQGKAELLQLLEIVQGITPKIILEIGIDRGYSLENWKKAFPLSLVMGIQDNDIALKARPEGDLDLPAIVFIGDSHTTDTFKRVKNTLDGDLIDFLFIDGDHSYQGVMEDFVNYSPLVRSGGIIAFHDADLHDHPDVHVDTFWQELTATLPIDRWKLITKQDGTGVGIYYKE